MDRDEHVYLLMMDALDGELSDPDYAELESHLRARPDLAREWEALQAVDALFKNAPLLRPAATFTQRTVARLPNARQRLWAGMMIYLLFLASGIVPLLVIIWTSVQFIPALGQPAIFEALLQVGAEVVRLVNVVLTALLRAAGAYVSEQPTLMVWPLLMVVLVTLWLRVYSRLVLRPQQVYS